MMERLTQRAEVGKKVFFSDDACFLCGYNKERSSTFCENIGCESTFDRSCPYLAVIDRLADYEDTGLTPEEVKDMADSAETRLLTWFEAKYGFPVGVLMDLCEAKEQGRLVTLPCRVGDRVYISGHKFPAQIEEIVINALDGITFNWAEYDRGPEETELWDDGWFEPKDIGKTVFLTREEAENALRGGADQ